MGCAFFVYHLHDLSVYETNVILFRKESKTYLLRSDSINCPKCNNEMIKCYADEGLAGIVVKNPKGKGLFSNKKTSSVNPIVCGDCGYTEWYADEPEKLK